VLAWQEWLDGEYDRPSRSDFYLMQIAAEIRSFMGMFSRGIRRVRIKDFVLSFFGKKKKGGLTPEQDAAVAKQMWKARGMRGLTPEQLPPMDPNFAAQPAPDVPPDVPPVQSQRRSSAALEARRRAVEKRYAENAAMKARAEGGGA
jgi:hypothetical protein